MTETLLDSETVSRILDISYPKLMRLVRAGYVQPATWTGKPRTPVWWTRNDIRRAEIANKLVEIGARHEDIPMLLDRFWGYFESGYLPMWVGELGKPKTGEPFMGYLCIYHEGGMTITGKEKTIKIDGEVARQMEVYSLPFEWVRRKRRGKR
ncbi:MAG: hypothetical protein KIT79_15295 [Deltaproteobacteria bacterium]|nr:hypothetical protein [Deltaproteobacteria bacterium]